MKEGVASLSFAKQFQVLVPAWNNAFSKEVNLKAWKKGGFAADGIRMTPLWDQKKMDTCASIKERAFSKAEMKRGAMAKFGLNGTTYKFDEVLRMGKHKRTVDEVCAPGQAAHTSSHALHASIASARHTTVRS